VPVVSVGNLAVGGTGKTPMVLWLCEEFVRQGFIPAVLTRGYRRTGGETGQIYPPGATPPVDACGEEAALILRQGLAWVGVGPDRAKNLEAILTRVSEGGPSGPRGTLRSRKPVVAILDDGFQHWRMARHADIVLIDALDPFRGGVLPAGRLREPFSALARATAIVITRTEPGRAYAGLIAEIRRHNPGAPVILARTVAEPPKLPQGSFGAFCGLGQPEAFVRTLNELGLKPEFVETFSDHHHYSAAEIAGLKSRSPVLLTTEKDLMNVPAAAREGVVAIPIRLVLDDPERLLASLNLPGIPGSA
jgi:tetraacyldisaccharide 4'-kinase